MILDIVNERTYTFCLKYYMAISIMFLLAITDRLAQQKLFITCSLIYSEYK